MTYVNTYASVKALSDVVLHQFQRGEDRRPAGRAGPALRA